MFSKYFKYLLSIILFSALILPSFSFSQESLDTVCDIKNIEKIEKNSSEDEYRALLEKCKNYYDAEILEIEKDVSKTEKEKKSLKNEIYLLNKKIKNLNYQISQNNVIVEDLGLQINDTVNSIGRTTTEIEDSRGGLAGILREINEEDNRSVIELLLSEEKISDFYNNLTALEAINNEIKNEVKNIKDLKFYLETQKGSLDSEKQEMQSMIIMQKLKKDENAGAKKDQEYFLSITEKEYKKYVAEQKEAREKSTQIGKLLFQLLEVPEGGIDFEDAVELAKETSAQIGIRPAFALAILWQETRIGKNVGGCYLKDAKTGNGIKIKTGNKTIRNMKVSRDVPPFLRIIDDLNNAGKWEPDAFHTPISCWPVRYVDGKPWGFGGAMGPAQFIASTWEGEVKDDIEKITGDIPANPWNVRDAFLANGLYLKKLGAGAQTYNKEIYSALNYFGCTNDWCKRNYGVPVMNVAECCQQYIDDGSMTQKCQDLVF